MIKKLILVLFWTCLASAQVVVGNFGVQYVTSAPSGTCSQNNAMQQVMGTGLIYTCQTGTWTQIGAGAGSVTSFSAPTGFTVTNPTTTPALVMPSGWGTGSLLLGNGAASVANLAIGSTPSFYLSTNGTTAAWTQVGLGQVGNPAAGTTFSYATNQTSNWVFVGNGRFNITGPLTISPIGGTGTAILTVPAAAGTPTFTLPPDTGTITVTSGSVSTASQTGNASGTLVTGDTLSAGMYQISLYMASTDTCATPGPASAVMAITYQDSVGAHTLSIPVNGAGVTSGTTVGLGDAVSFGGGSQIIWLAASQNVTYASTFTACTTGTAHYTVRLSALRLTTS